MHLMFACYKISLLDIYCVHGRSNFEEIIIFYTYYFDSCIYFCKFTYLRVAPLFIKVNEFLFLSDATCSANGFSLHCNGTTTNGVTNGVSKHLHSHSKSVVSESGEPGDYKPSLKK